MKLLYKPVGLLCGLLAGAISKRLAETIWRLIDDRPAPHARTTRTTWPKVIASAAVQGVSFSVTRAAVDRGGARAFEHLTGVWPGEPEPPRE